MSATALPAQSSALQIPGRLSAGPALGGLVALLATSLVVAAGIGAFPVSPAQVLAIVLRPLADLGVPYGPQHEAVLWSIRLPRVAFGALVGAALALAGAVLQGLFRNPMADPTLIGISPGAALAAAGTIVLGATWWPEALGAWRAFALPLAAFGGGLVTTLVVYRLATVEGRTSLPVMLLAGISITAMSFAGIGFFSFIATDDQLRNLTFWNLGSLAAASPLTLAVSSGVLAAAAAAFARIAPALNVLALGEAEASHLGVDLERVKRVAVIACAAVVGATVAFTGIIGFVGLVAPHFVRLACGPDHRVVLPGAMLCGALLVVVADAFARTVVSPAELPIGVLCAFLGGPFFLVLLLRQRTQGAF